MSFHAGQSFTFGETPSATKWNYLWENDYALADGTGISADAITNSHIASVAATKITMPYAFMGKRTSALNAPTTVAAIQYDTEEYDTGNNFDVSTNKGRFTAPVAGIYLFYWSCLAAVTSGDHIYTGLMKNGSEIRRTIETNASATVNQVYGGCLAIKLAQNDYIEHYWIAPATRAFLVGSTPPYLWFGGHLVSQ